jgi:hypothetical protein
MSKEVNSVRDANRAARNLAKSAAVKAFNEAYRAFLAPNFDDESKQEGAVLAGVKAFNQSYKQFRAEGVGPGTVGEEAAA